ncbi:WYL domain-containing protein [Sphingorhabdus soli]|uniref:WYL domain-containing protein n=1 Tax=Flavisphingopyxis soli TaxID=2601267 RepID=A0A5C6UPG9_9SPHN|nr:WYL domain-containing protein [Sphingorhabdus soli]TXC74036.1 WYL domain-containing protein [Sphingorhabdus soli]
MGVFEQIREAIEARTVIEFDYKSSRRVVEPHLVGINRKGNLTLSAFQLSGGSGVSFRAFMVDEISGLRTLDEGFDGPRPGFNPNDQTMDSVLFTI